MYISSDGHGSLFIGDISFIIGDISFCIKSELWRNFGTFKLFLRDNFCKSYYSRGCILGVIGFLFKWFSIYISFNFIIFIIIKLQIINFLN